MSELTNAEYLRKFGNHTVTVSLLDQTLDQILDRLFARERALEERIKVLEARPVGASASWEGVWKDERTYGTGALVTHAGGLWCCMEDTGTKPGTPHGASYWKLIVKSGSLERVA